MWRCPVCGQTFVTRNVPHSCGVVDLDRFFEGSDLRELFDRFVAAVGRPAAGVGAQLVRGRRTGLLYGRHAAQTRFARR